MHRTETLSWLSFIYFQICLFVIFFLLINFIEKVGRVRGGSRRREGGVAGKVLIGLGSEGPKRLSLNCFLERSS